MIKVCEACKKEFQPKTRPPRLCPECRESLVVCGDCGRPAMKGFSFCSGCRDRRLKYDEMRHERERAPEASPDDFGNVTLILVVPPEMYLPGPLQGEPIGDGWFRLH